MKPLSQNLEPPPLANFSAIILAAGLSSRMGACKPLLPLGGTTVLARMLELFRGVGVAEIMVVLGHRAGDLRQTVRSGGGRAVLNGRYQEGMFSSLQAGVWAIAPGCRGFFVMPADIPLVKPSTLTALARTMSESGKAIVCPVFAGRRGHPPLISCELTEHILSWREPGGLRQLLAAHREQARDLPVDDPGILRDMDTPADYQAILRSWAGEAKRL